MDLDFATCDRSDVASDDVAPGERTGLERSASRMEHARWRIFRRSFVLVRAGQQACEKAEDAYNEKKA